MDEETIEVIEEIDEEEIEVEEEAVKFGRTQEKSIEITQNGITNVTPDESYDGISKVTINANVTPNNQSKSETITENGSVTISPDSGYEGLSTVNITTNVSPTLQSKSVTITQNGVTTTITKDEGYDGLNNVEVTTNIAGADNNAKFVNPAGGNTIPMINYIVSFDNVDLSQCSKYTYAFQNFAGLKRVTILNDNSDVERVDYMFQSCGQLEEAPFLRTGNCTNFDHMFQACSNLRHLPLYDTSHGESFVSFAYNCSELLDVPQFDTSNATNFGTMFRSCKKLVTIPALNTSKITNFTNIVNGCNLLSNESLNNLLIMCLNATSYTGTKSLITLGLNITQRTTCKSFPIWSDLVAAGWTD